jgi:sirohydrochlorin ferrochelatase
VAEFWDLLEQIGQRLPGTRLEGCFLELAPPSIEAAMERFARHQIGEVAVMPLMLFEAGHAKVDIPRAARSAAEPLGLTVSMLDALNDHPCMIELSALRFQSVVEQFGVEPREVHTLLVGRGSRDRKAMEQFYDFRDQRIRVTGEHSCQGAFMAMAEPRIETALEQCAQKPHKWVAVQPHLLFAGALLDRLTALVSEQDQRDERQRWLIGRHLGAHQLVAETVLQRFSQAISPQQV